MEKCSYCGTENESENGNCSGCGNPLSDDNQIKEPKKKSKAVAIILALIFGPLGLLYLGFEGVIIILFLIGIVFFFYPLLIGLKIGAVVAFFGRVASAIYAASAVEKRNPTTNIRAKAIEMLTEAARLETKDRELALEKYQEIIRTFPNSAASGEAERAIGILKKSVL